MDIGKVILLAVSSNLDDLGAGFSLGLKERVCNRFISVIALISAVTMLTGLLLGQQISSFITIQTASYISALIFVLLSAWFVWKGLKSKKADAQVTTKISTVKNAIILGIALGIDSVTLGVSAGLVYYPMLLTSLLAGVSSFLFIWAGSKFGNAISIGFIRNKSDFIAAAILFFLGISQVW